MVQNFGFLKKLTRQAEQYHKALKTGKGGGNITIGAVNPADLSGAFRFEGLSTDVLKDLSKAQAAYNIPGSSVGATARNGIMGSVTNNYMNNNVNVNAQGASADQVADIVIRRLDMQNNRNIGGA